MKKFISYHFSPFWGIDKHKIIHHSGYSCCVGPNFWNRTFILPTSSIGTETKNSRTTNQAIGTGERTDCHPFGFGYGKN